MILSLSLQVEKVSEKQYLTITTLQKHVTPNYES